MKDIVQLSRHLLIPLEMWLHDNQLRTKTFGHLNGLCRMHSEPSGPVPARCPYITRFQPQGAKNIEPVDWLRNNPKTTK